MGCEQYGLPAAALLAAAAVLTGCTAGADPTPQPPVQRVALPAPVRPTPALTGARPWPGGVSQAVNAVPLTPAAAPVRGSSSTRRGSSTAPAATAVVPPCLPLLRPGSTVPVVVTTTGAVMVASWWHNGDPAAVGYHVGVRPRVWVRATTPGTALTMAPIRWTRVRPRAGCRTMRFAVPGARRGVDYAVWLEADLTTPEFTPGTTRVALGRATARLP